MSNMEFLLNTLLEVINSDEEYTNLFKIKIDTRKDTWCAMLYPINGYSMEIFHKNKSVKIFTFDETGRLVDEDLSMDRDNIYNFIRNLCRKEEAIERIKQFIIKNEAVENNIVQWLIDLEDLKDEENDD